MLAAGAPAAASHGTAPLGYALPLFSSLVALAVGVAGSRRVIRLGWKSRSFLFFVSTGKSLLNGIPVERKKPLRYGWRRGFLH